MDSNEEFQGILKGVTSQDLRDMLDKLPDADSEREELEIEDESTRDSWGSSGSLKYRRDY